MTKTMEQAPNRRRKGGLRRPQLVFGAIALTITFTWYVVFFFDPIVRGILMSFQDYQLFDPSNSPFVGLENYAALFDFDRFWTAFFNTIRFTVLLYVVTMP
jgi:multiple sugar transport system permease protein